MRKVFKYENKVIVVSSTDCLVGKYPTKKLPEHMLDDINTINIVGATAWHMLRTVPNEFKIFTYTNPDTKKGYKVIVYNR